MGIVILILLVPSWRVKFQGFVQGFFMTHVVLENKVEDKLFFSPDEWVLYDHNKKRVSFHELKNKPIVLNFWATWCPSCRAELPEINKLHDAIGNDAYVIAVSNEKFETILARQL